jgi:O-acetyl-ADP-ribose deacetylase (regulator of RNase III)
MGAGIAKTFKEKFPVNYEAYYRKCFSSELNPGDIFSVYENKHVVINIASQMNPGADARYHWLYRACYGAAAYATADNYWNRKGAEPVIAIPQIGCGIGGLEWPKVKTLLEAIEILIPGFEWEVWTL